MNRAFDVFLLSQIPEMTGRIGGPSIDVCVPHFRVALNHKSPSSAKSRFDVFAETGQGADSVIQMQKPA